MSESTSINIEMRTYYRGQYACRLRLKKPRPQSATPHIQDVMARYLRRGVRDQAVVMGVARFSTHEDFETGQKMLQAVAYAYQGVHPDDAEILSRYVDIKAGQMVRVPARYIPSLRVP